MKVEIINGKAIAIKEINNQRLITFKEIDEVHERPEGTAKRNFTKNKKHFIKEEDYYTIRPSDFQKYEIRSFDCPIPNRGITLITESGYLMIVKSLNDDLAWKVQRELVNIYFKAKEVIANTKENNLAMENILQALLAQQQEYRLAMEATNQQIIQTIVQSQQAQTAQLTALTTLITSALPKPYKPLYTRWMGSIYAKVDTIANSLNLTRKQTLHKLYMELQDTYDLDLNEYCNEYCCTHNLEDAGLYTMNAIEANPQLKRLFQVMVDNYIEQQPANRQNMLTQTHAS